MPLKEKVGNAQIETSLALKTKSLSKLIERLFNIKSKSDYLTTVSSITSSFFFNASAAFPFLTESYMIGVAINNDE